MLGLRFFSEIDVFFFSHLELGTFLHPCEGELVCRSTNPKVPQFNAPIYLPNKTPIGKVDEVLGPINQVVFTIKTAEGIQATSFRVGDKVCIAAEKLLPMERFLPKPKPPPGSVSKIKKPRGGAGGRGGSGARGRGSFGARGGRGGPGMRGGRGGGGRGGGGFSAGRGGGRGGSGFGGRGGGGNRGRGGFSSRGR